MTNPLTSPDGTAVRRFAFGTMQFGGRASDADSAEMFNACLAAGITHFDTAWVYNDGRSEEILGRLAAAHRDHLFIATKVGMRVPATRETLLRQFDESRQRLNMDMVDALYLHQFDPQTELGDIMEVFNDLKDAGKIRYIALSNFAAWQVMKARQYGPVDLLQPMYSLVKRQAEVEILPMCADQGIAVASYSPLGGGLLTGKYLDGGDGRLTEVEMYAQRYRLDWMHRAASDLVKLALEVGTHPATLAVAWVAAHQTTPMPIISARTAGQLKPSLDALSFEMSPELYRRVSDIAPAPAPATDRLEEA
ncbi:Predicted oxidoreductase [Poseidonocella pacifica]|uniref:Predicted oxidoreductase n=1 Tax=Poseidonocella pacifica TaxID=871651 RepID=A0A1I0WG63_9RHOB|nr:aldo/keto reductase [Poseidonocella pacifica]SFA87631.1 Predicted oxidoreductase [Poseidonocella pacifica]